MVSSKKLHFCIHGTSSIQKYLPRFLRHRGSPSFRDARHEWATIPSCDVLVPDQVRSPPPELDFSLFANPGISPERLVDAVRDLEQFLPKGCEHLGPEDLKIIGSFPVDAGGFADVWLGERNGIAVAIKHYRHNASSDLPSIYLVSGVRYCSAFPHIRPLVEDVQRSVKVQVSQRPEREFRAIHRNILDSRAPTLPGFYVDGPPQSPRVFEESPARRQIEVGKCPSRYLLLPSPYQFAPVIGHRPGHESSA